MTIRSIMGPVGSDLPIWIKESKMTELVPGQQYYAAVDKDGRVVGPVGRDPDYVRQVMEAAFSRDNVGLRIETEDDLERAVKDAGYRVLKCRIITEE